MLLSHAQWLCIILPTLVFATPQQNLSDASQVSLPENFQKHVPTCAQPCLLASLAEQFPLACTVPSTSSCLCSTYSIGGQSLGEIALGCLYTSCSPVGREADEAYNICFGQTDAVKPTLTALTVVAAASQKSATTSMSSLIVPTEAFTTTLHTMSSPVPTETVHINSAPSIPSSTPTSSPTQSSLAGAADRPQTMKPEQIAGLSVAAAAAFIIAIGLVFLSIFLRKRRERRKEIDINEKSGLPSPRPDKPSRSTYYFDKNRSLPELPIAQLPMPPTSVRTIPKASTGTSPMTVGTRHQQPSYDVAASRAQPGAIPPTNLELVHPLLRQTSMHPNTMQSSTSPPDQIGLAITDELPKRSDKTGNPWQPVRRPSSKELRKLRSSRTVEIPQRPDSTVTQCTVFEEDEVPDVPECRPPSALLPAFPVPPIRSLQPSRPPPPKFNLERPAHAPATQKPLPGQPDLFLDIPPRQSKMHNSSNGDIPEYYFTSHRSLRGHKRTDSPQGPKELAKPSNTKLKLSSSNVSRATSRASTNIRDSLSSRTSFESVVTDDPTPESEDDNQLSPVAESPISNLRYPKVPRASNQLVPRSPASPHSQNSRDSPRWPPEPSSLLVKRLGEQGALQLGGPLHLGTPTKPDAKNHMCSNSMEVLTPVRANERSMRAQSGAWPPKSPAMYEPSVIRPLSIRPKQQLLQPPQETMDVLKSPAWITNLTPTRQGEDLLISVTYSKANR
ncbi:hypothetical protein DM02DRAFT_654479 [Periconia macrospinosa]|uniref:Extracellular membrane protein CFEM domain-containing protein n=1 Tax=Periconia macrospinosa TaxID=97972 RepID=A0A2V1DTU8_9PLEO|nr:hypothetical protein DM02DRAFT_654479 [Periconia macrospinosa]